MTYSPRLARASQDEPNAAMAWFFRQAPAFVSASHALGMHGSILTRKRHCHCRSFTAIRPCSGFGAPKPRVKPQTLSRSRGRKIARISHDAQAVSVDADRIGLWQPRERDWRPTPSRRMRLQALTPAAQASVHATPAQTFADAGVTMHASGDHLQVPPRPRAGASWGLPRCTVPAHIPNVPSDFTPCASPPRHSARPRQRQKFRLHSLHPCRYAFR